MTTLHRLPSEGQIAKQIRQIFFPLSIRCPQCRRRYDYKIQGRYFCKKCRLKFSKKRCTPFAHSKLSEKQLWFLLSCWLGQLSPQDTRGITGLSYPRIHRWLVRFSKLLPDISPALGGTLWRWMKLSLERRNMTTRRLCWERWQEIMDRSR